MLDSGILSYYLSPEEVKSGSRGAFKVSSCNIRSESREDRHGRAWQLSVGAGATFKGAQSSGKHLAMHVRCNA